MKKKFLRTQSSALIAQHLLDRVIFLFMRIHQRGFKLLGVFTVGNIHGSVKALAEHLERMIERLKAICNADIVLHLDHTTVIEFDDLAACCADQVIVMRAVDGLFILSMSLRKSVARY